MVDRDITSLAGDIRAISTLLNLANYYWRQPSTNYYQSRAFPRTPVTPGSFSHISTLVNLWTGTPVAVTGTLTSENVNVVIVYPKTLPGPGRQQQSEQERFVSPTVIPSTRSLVEIARNRPQCLEDYIGDLIDLFRIAHSGEIPGGTIMQWVICRGWSKLYTLFKRSETDFNDLFGAMEAWAPGDFDNIPERVIVLAIMPSLYAKYTDLAVNCTDHGAEFTLNKTSAPILIKVIARIFVDIRQTLADPNANRSTDAASLADLFIWLHVVLSNKYVKAVIVETSLWYTVFPRWPERLRGDDDLDRIEPLPGYQLWWEDEYLLRYLRALVACATSVVRLCDRDILPLFSAAHVTVVSLPSPAHDTESERRRIVQAIIADIRGRGAPADAGWPQAASDWIDRLADRAVLEEQNEGSTSCRIHAEASLMALACEARLSCGDGEKNNKYGGPLAALSESNFTPMQIGTSGKSCLLCFRLTQILNAHFAEVSQPGNLEALEFPLVPTHGKVVPWDPPQFGIPQPVLQRLRDELWERLVEEVVSVGKRDAAEDNVSSRPREDELRADLISTQGRITLSEDIYL